MYIHTQENTTTSPKPTHLQEGLFGQVAVGIGGLDGEQALELVAGPLDGVFDLVGVLERAHGNALLGGPLTTRGSR
jgi:hypothetical protein